MKELEKQNREYLLLEEDLQSEIDSLIEERSNCGFFAFSKKKELDNAIDDAEDEMEMRLNEKDDEIQLLNTRIDDIKASMESVI